MTVRSVADGALLPVVQGVPRERADGRAAERAARRGGRAPGAGGAGAGRAAHVQRSRYRV